MRYPPPIITLLIVGAALLSSCADTEAPATQDWAWNLPPGIPAPQVPDTNPMSAARVELGRHLFYDTRLSGNQSQSCASCHSPDLAFTDGLRASIGSTGQPHPRSSMSLANVAYSTTLNWANPLTRELPQQALTPLFGEEPVELGLSSQAQLLDRLRADSDYLSMFKEAFPDAHGPDLINLDRVTRALASFQRTLLSFDSPYDRYLYRSELDALTDAQKRGMQLFFSERLECFHCHGGFNFADSTLHDGTVFVETRFHNTGLYNLDSRGAYPPGNRGLYDITGDPDDMGRFKAPTLRNIEVTAPYMHDGSIATLDEVIDHYARGGRLISDGPLAGDGRDNPLKSELITGFQINDDERADLIAFLRSLTDRSFLENPDHANPFDD